VDRLHAGATQYLQQDTTLSLIVVNVRFLAELPIDDHSITLLPAYTNENDVPALCCNASGNPGGSDGIPRGHADRLGGQGRVITVVLPLHRLDALAQRLHAAM